MIFSNLKVPNYKLQDMKIKPLTQLRETISRALSGMANLHKPFQTFFICTMELYLSVKGRLNFTSMARNSESCESRFRQNFRKCFDWLGFNMQFVSADVRCARRIAIAIDPCFISKSGKKTPGLAYFWSGCAKAAKWGLEILGISAVNADSREATFLKAVQTDPGKKRGKTPKCCRHIQKDKRQGLFAKYLRTLLKDRDRLLSISTTIVADAFFSKINFVLGLDCLGFNLVSRLRDDAVFRYLYTGERTGKRGCPKKFDGKVDICNPDGKVFTTTSFTDGNDSIRLTSGIVWCNSLKRKVVLAIVEYLDSGKKTQVRKLYFSTDLTMSGLDVYMIYRARFQEEYLYRDSKQHLGLTNCQARSAEALDFAFNMSLSSINVARQCMRELKLDLSIGSFKTMIHNARMLELFISMFGKTPNVKINDTVFKELILYGVRDAA